MSTSRAQLQSALAVHEVEALRLILRASNVSFDDTMSAAQLADKIAESIWWSYSTPLGYLADQSDLERIVRHVSMKLHVEESVERQQDVWTQLTQLTRALVRTLPAEGISLDTLDASTRSKLSASWIPTVVLGSTAGSSFATRWGAGKALRLLRTPIGRLLPFLPAVGPWVGPLRSGLTTVHLVAGPLGVALSVLSVNQALGANYRRLVPLLLGVGALRPDKVDDAEELAEE